VGLEAGADGEMLKNGDRVLITQSAVVLEKLIGQFMFDRAADAPAQ
jgi:phospholipid/cholesterol/gamma-HCH transport system substrate-binding protein